MNGIVSVADITGTVHEVNYTSHDEDVLRVEIERPDTLPDSLWEDGEFIALAEAASREDATARIVAAQHAYIDRVCGYRPCRCKDCRKHRK